MQKYHWRNVFVLIDDTSINVYAMVCLSAIKGISTLPNRVVTARHIINPIAEEYRQALLQFRDISRGTFGKSM